MNLKGLWLKEWLLLCERAEQACAERFRGLAERAPNKRVGEILRSLAEEEEEHLREIRRLDEKTPWPIVCHVDGPAIDKLVRLHFPSLGLAPEKADRASVLRFARSVEQESSRFYRTLAVLAPDEASEKFFRGIAEREEDHQRNLEEISIP